MSLASCMFQRYLTRQGESSLSFKCNTGAASCDVGAWCSFHESNNSARPLSTESKNLVEGAKTSSLR
jgi:hypothetical protein